MSTRPFVIAGLPFVGSGWLSLFLSAGKTLCYHEPHLSDVTDLGDLLSGSYYDHAGAYDSAYSFFLPWVLDALKARVVLIVRDPQQAKDDLRAQGALASNYVDLLYAEMLRYRAHPAVLWVPLDSLDKKRTIMKIFFHLMPDVAFDEVRYEQFAKMRVEARAEAQPQRVHLLKDVLPRIEYADGIQPN